MFRKKIKAFIAKVPGFFVEAGILAGHLFYFPSLLMFLTVSYVLMGGEGNFRCVISLPVGCFHQSL